MQYYGDRGSSRNDSERKPLVGKQETRPEEPPPSYASVVNIEVPNVQDPGMTRKTMPVPVPVLVQISRTSYVPSPERRRITTAPDIEEDTLVECSRVFGSCVGVATLLILLIVVGARLSVLPPSQS